MKIIDMLITIFCMIIISTSLTVPTQLMPQFHVEAWLPFRNREMTIHQKCTEFPTEQQDVIWAILYV